MSARSPRSWFAAVARLAGRPLADAPAAADRRGRIAWLRARLGARWSVVLLLLLPAVFRIVRFGPRAALVLGSSVGLCVAVGIGARHLDGEPWRLLNPGTLITGLLLGLTLSSTTPLYMIVIGALVAELLGKHPLPLLGRNLFNPAALGRGAVALCELVDPPARATDLVTAPSPLFKDGGGALPPHLSDLLMGFTPGAIGETNALVLALVAVPMFAWVARKRVAGLAMLVTVPLLIALLPATADIAGHAPWVLDPLVFVLGGSTLLYAVFFLTDPATTPDTVLGAVLFGVGVGVLGVLGRLYTTIPGAEMWALLIMNAAAPALDRLGGRRLVGADERAEPGASVELGAASFYLDAGEAPSVADTWGTEGDGAGWTRLAGAEAVWSLPEARRTPARIRAEVEASGLTGCGGSHFDVARKWALALSHPGPRVLVVNGQEGEPDSAKDRVLMERCPGAVLSGAALAAVALDADEVVVVVGPTFDAAHAALADGLERLRAAAPSLAARFRLVHGPGLYVCGEETALLEFLEGRRGEPQLRPPYPAERGLRGRPTVVHNVETLAWIPTIVGDGGRAFAAAPSKLVTVGGEVRRPGVLCVPLGITIEALIGRAGGPVEGRAPFAFAVGGPSGGLLPASLASTPLDPGALKEAGASLGSGSVKLLTDTAQILDEVGSGLDFFAEETCGRCTPCRVGTGQLRDLFDSVAGDPTLAPGSARELRERMERLAVVMEAASTCGLGRGAPSLLRSTERYWPELLEGRSWEVA